MLFFSHFLLPIVAKEFRKDKLQTSKNVTTIHQTCTISTPSFPAGSSSFICPSKKQTAPPFANSSSFPLRHTEFTSKTCLQFSYSARHTHTSFPCSILSPKNLCIYQSTTSARSFFICMTFFSSHRSPQRPIENVFPRYSNFVNISPSA